MCVLLLLLLLLVYRDSGLLSEYDELGLGLGLCHYCHFRTLHFRIYSAFMVLGVTVLGYPVL